MRSRGKEVPAREVGVDPVSVAGVWARVEELFRTGLYPAIQICIRRRGQVVLEGSLGHASGGAPEDPLGTPRVKVGVDTPICIYSASKAITAMLIHKLDEQGWLRLDDRVCDFIPEFAANGKQEITIRHLLGHRAGIPNVPTEALDLDLLARPDLIAAILCESEPTSRPGQRLAYHAISSGFVFAELVQRITKRDIREVLDREIARPMGFRFMRYGVREEDVPLVAQNSLTGLPPIRPFSALIERALGMELAAAVDLSNDPRFLTGIVPSANIVASARELATFYQCLLDEGRFGASQIFEPRTVHRATLAQTFLEFDLTLGLPIPYGLGFMLGGSPLGIFGPHCGNAFGHLGFTNILSWADPDRELAVAILTTGKPFISLDVLKLIALLFQIDQTFPPTRT